VVRLAVGRWGWVCVATTAFFVVLALIVRLAGVSTMERQLHDAVTSVLPVTPIPIFRWITRLGSETVLFPASVILIVLLPRQFLRHWWLWVTVMLAVSIMEGLGKAVVGRPRPNGLRPGFPSGHTAAAAAFYMMACYFASELVRRRSARFLLYSMGTLLIVGVGLSRMALGVHWPLDVLGGAGLGLAVLAGAVWWHEQHPDVAALDVAPSVYWPDVVYRWQNLTVVGLIGVLFLRAPLAAEDSLLDLMFDLSGGACIVVGLLLRLWSAHHHGKPTAFLRVLPSGFITSGPYALMRQPVLLGTVLIAVGVVLLAESGPGLILIPAMLIIVSRVAIQAEEAHLAKRCGREYAEYCRRVPRWPRPRRALFVAVASAMCSGGSGRWRCIVQELPTVVTTLVLAALAEASELMPHLLP
jgi:undecaprenyl-diphosphatase